MLTKWKYSGDINLKYGGVYFRHDLNKNGFPNYTDIVEIIDLESACGADGIILLSFASTFDYENKEKVKNALFCWGYTVKDLHGRGKEEILDLLALSFHGYGYSDSSPDYFSHNGNIVLIYDYDQFSDKRSWNGWKPDINHTKELHFNYDGNLKEYIEEVWLK